jgi:hypothetical protein
MPLFLDAHGFDVDFVEKILEKRQKILFGYAGGIPFDEIVTGEQWDFPNVWAPFQYYLVRLFEKMGQEKEIWKFKSLDLAQRFINSAYTAYGKSKHFYEKYNAKEVGFPGGGGEYIVQDGFGWTNGVILWILKRYGNLLCLPPTQRNPNRSEKLSERKGSEPSTTETRKHGTKILFQKIRPVGSVLPVNLNETASFWLTVCFITLIILTSVALWISTPYSSL